MKGILVKLISRSYRLRHLPLRAATGAFILNAGLGKQDMPEEQAAGLQAAGAQAFPAVESMEPAEFGKALAHSETALGAALLAPMVPSGVAGAGLAAFGAALLAMYVRNPEMREPNSLRPSRTGTPLAKDFWLLGIGLGLMVDAWGMRRARRS